MSLKPLLKGALALMLLVTPAIAEDEAAEKQQVKEYDPAKMAEVLTINEHDTVQGDESAETILIEYSSLSCSHCATFHNTAYPTIKEKYIETGKIRFVNRDFPLNAPALKAAVLVECAPADKRPKFKEVLFKLQNKWAFTPEYLDALKKIGNVGGVSEETYDACLADEALEERILNVRKEAQDNLPISGTPTFFLNGKKMPLDEINSENMSTEIDKALAK